MNTDQKEARFRDQQTRAALSQLSFPRVSEAEITLRESACKIMKETADKLKQMKNYGVK